MSEDENSNDSQDFDGQHVDDDQNINEEEGENEFLNNEDENFEGFNDDDENGNNDIYENIDNDIDENGDENLDYENSQYAETQELDDNTQSTQVLDDDDDVSNIFSQTESQTYISRPLQKLYQCVNTYSAYIYQFPATIAETTIFLQLPRSILPLSLQSVGGFLSHNILLEITIILDNFDWRKKPSLLTIQHPTKKDKYVGYPLIQTATENFFSPDYKPRSFYRSYSFLLTPSGEADPGKVKQLNLMGFDDNRGRNALVLCSNDLNKAVQFLKTGDLPSQDNLIKVEYDECPLLYFVLEIAECFLDLQDHCCICRKKIPAGLKPTICDSQFCDYRFTQVGVGISVVQEIQRDPLAADLIFSIFSSAIGSKYFNPKPPDLSEASLNSLVDKLPRMDELAKCADDAQLLKMINKNQLTLLRWVLLSNRSQMISLQSKLKLPIFGSAFQFLSLISTPTAEQKFKALKEKYGSMYLFHGSATQNWHSILRNGLKNASGTGMMAHGNAYGPGIYFAHEARVSQGYAPACKNGYTKSKLGQNLQILALCEIAKVPELLHHGWAHTLTNEEACIVRFLLVNGDYDTDVMKSPPKNVPKLKDVLNFEADKK